MHMKQLSYADKKAGFWNFYILKLLIVYLTASWVLMSEHGFDVNRLPRVVFDQSAWLAVDFACCCFFFFWCIASSRFAEQFSSRFRNSYSIKLRKNCCCLLPAGYFVNLITSSQLWMFVPWTLSVHLQLDFVNSIKFVHFLLGKLKHLVWYHYISRKAAISAAIEDLVHWEFVNFKSFTFSIGQIKTSCLVSL